LLLACTGGGVRSKTSCNLAFFEGCGSLVEAGELRQIKIDCWDQSPQRTKNEQHWWFG